MNILELATEQEALLIKLRRQIHEHPELGNYEFHTLEVISKFLEENGVEYVTVPKGGIFGFITGTKGSSPKTVMLRADIDALPIQESPTNLCGPKACVSKIDGVSHACGHDAHTAMLLVTAKILQEHRDEFDGRIILMFERGEEGVENCYFLLKWLQEHKTRIDACWAIHVRTGFESGHMSLREGGNACGLCCYEVTLNGRGGHGSEPHQSINPINCYTAISTALDSLRGREIDALETLSQSTCYVQAGSKANIIPDTLRFGGTARFFKHDTVGQQFKEAFYRICDGIAKAYRCTVSYDFFLGPTPALINNDQCVEIARDALTKAIGADRISKLPPQMGSESMAEVQLYYPGCYAYLGIDKPELGTGSELHSAKFDLDESALKYGVTSSIAYALEVLSTDKEIKFTPYTGDLRALYSDQVDKL